ncbi:MAG: hypothetical protein FJ161_05045 [Gammaproteobacteria bacterium]|nr:hypothetical protein [Gammaproteobacteria bacterium]
MNNRAQQVMNFHVPFNNNYAVTFSHSELKTLIETLKAWPGNISDREELLVKLTSSDVAPEDIQYVHRILIKAYKQAQDCIVDDLHSIILIEMRNAYIPSLQIQCHAEDLKHYLAEQCVDIAKMIALRRLPDQSEYEKSLIIFARDFLSRVCHKLCEQHEDEEISDDIPFVEAFRAALSREKPAESEEKISHDIAALLKQHIQTKPEVRSVPTTLIVSIPEFKKIVSELHDRHKNAAYDNQQLSAYHYGLLQAVDHVLEGVATLLRQTSKLQHHHQNRQHLFDVLNDIVLQHNEKMEESKHHPVHMASWPPEAHSHLDHVVSMRLNATHLTQPAEYEMLISELMRKIQSH